MAEHDDHLGEDLLAGLLGFPQPPVSPPPAVAARRNRERAVIHRQLADLYDHLAGLDDAIYGIPHR